MNDSDFAMTTNKVKILVSACLLGRPVRYNGSAKTIGHPALALWQEEGRLVPICPELQAGFSIPRPPAEIADGKSGLDVIFGRGRVLEATGADVTGPFLEGARAALSVARAQGCRFAILVDGSPSCGSGFIYDGGFNGSRHVGTGVTAALLWANGIEVFSENEIGALEIRFSQNCV